ncbi:uncharacterized protein BDR25DRAFT_17236 [Lindgomyces ingoldianus]|uniref:Uncharacterized protein n=1 Tax=Lindgomyces ingoldianus TaxID=673940 RepID=A0ACB6QY81_9PLEO|nr:uncharacterized protein BDR25DRAFT_17236 [Lindgomyces ingoldianus]KAF2472009.1 hypothetical protein BDR25DRAFT_17236 [Lindgomyces ingoldianus]
MPPRIRLWPRVICLRTTPAKPPPTLHCSYASMATVITTPAPPLGQAIRSASPVLRYPPTQPPSYKPPEVRKTQLHRQYQSLLKSSPLILLFQHNNLLAVEWMSIRRELASALAKTDAERQAAGSEDIFGSQIKIQIIQTGIFASALRVVEFFPPSEDPLNHAQNSSNLKSQSSLKIPSTTAKPEDARFTHGLSRHAHEVASNKKLKLELDPLLSGPLAIIAFPTVSPQHLKTVLSILSPSPDFPAPRRKANPDYHEPSVQSGLQKLMLLGVRVEGKVFDQEGAKWVGGIEGGIDGLRAQLVAVLQGVGAGVTNTLESASRNLYFTVEGRRMDMERKEKGEEEEEK